MVCPAPAVVHPPPVQTRRVGQQLQRLT